MPARNTIRPALPAAMALAALIGAACSASQPPAPPPDITPPAGASTPASATPEPSPLPSATASPSTDLSPTAPQVEGAPDVPYDMTGYELIAYSVGQATYSGYACVISPDGCSCELPTIQEVTFTFSPEGPMTYTFESDESAGAWEMSRGAPDQWIYSFSLDSQERGGQIGEGRVMISFTEEGFVYTQFINFFESGPVLCPEVPFRRLMSAGE
jgi:hypothetical protein